MTSYLWLVIAAGALGVLYGAIQTAALLKADAGNDKMREIAAAIQEGASAYLKRQYTTIGIVGIVILIAAYLLIGPYAAVGFLIGAVLSGAAGYAGMLISVRANVRTALAASKSLAGGLDLALDERIGRQDQAGIGHRRNHAVRQNSPCIRRDREGHVEVLGMSCALRRAVPLPVIRWVA